jgi:hypothetical protein
MTLTNYKWIVGHGRLGQWVVLILVKIDKERGVVMSEWRLALVQTSDSSKNSSCNVYSIHVMRKITLSAHLRV